MNQIIRNHARLESLEINGVNTPINTATEPGSHENRFGLLTWLAAATLILALLYGSSYLALLWLPRDPGLDMRSQLTADYSVWALIVFQPIDPAILREIQQEEGLPDEILINGSSWPTPTEAGHLPTSMPQAIFHESLSAPTALQQSGAATPMPTILVSPPASAMTPAPALTSMPASPTRPTKTPRSHKTPKPPKPTKSPKP